MQSNHFWRDEATGELWMRGGLVYLAARLVTVALRRGVAYASGAHDAQTAGTHPISPALAVLAADLLIVSMGLWIARARAPELKYREYDRTGRTLRNRT